MQAGTNIGENDRKHCAGSTKRVETPELPPYRDQAKLLSKKNSCNFLQIVMDQTQN